MSLAETMQTSDAHQLPTRERLLNAALVCFSRKGYHQTTTDEIVAESGMGKGTLYRYFENKQDLFISLIDWFFLEVSKEITHAWDDSMPAADKIRAMVQIFLDESEQLFPFFKITVDFWAQTFENDRLQRTFWTWLQQYQMQFSTVIDEGIAGGEFRVVNSKAVALGLVAMLDGVALYKTLLSKEIDFPGTILALMEAILAGLKTEV